MKINLFVIFILFTLKGFCQEDTTLFEHEELVIRSKSADYKGKEIYNADGDLKQLIEGEGTVECPVDYQFYYNPLSLVGTFFCYEYGAGGILACGVPSNSLRVQTINVNDNKPVSLAALFSEESILKAFKEDGWI